MFSKFNINTCKRKIHFLAQTYIETNHFRSTHEASGVCSGYKGGCDFRGRGMKQITHDYNYLAYYDYLKGTNYSNVFNNLRGTSNGVSVSDYLDQLDSSTNQKITTNFYTITLKEFTKDLSVNLFEAFDSAGWFSTIYKSSVLTKMDNGITDDDVEKVTKAINGGDMNLLDRQNATSYLKEHINYKNQCINN